MTASAIILRRAAELIERHGHAVGDYTGPDGQLCAHGAIIAACRGDLSPDKVGRRFPTLADSNDFRNARIMLHRWVRGHTDWPGVVSWNDRSPGAQVVAGLRAAADWDER